MDAKELTGKVALVTGGSRGIGRAISLKLASLGARVAVNYARSEEAAAEVVDSIKAGGAEAAAYQADVRDAASVRAMVRGIAERWDVIDILVNNAGIVRNELLPRLSEEDWDDVIDTTLKGAYLCCRFALRGMLDRCWGRIINISSVAALRGNYGQANYSAAKGGLISMTRSLAREVGSRSITVNAIAPGMIETDMMDTIPEAYRKEVFARLAIPRAGKAEDVAELVAFLSSERASYITAQVIAVDGGLI